MNPTIEELKNEDGQYRVRKISDTKILIDYKIPIFGLQAENSQNRKSVRLLETIRIKVRYRISMDERRHSNELPTYHLIPIKDRFMQLLSQNWKIKKKFIYSQRKSGQFIVDGFLISGLYCGFIFNDESWTRDYLLNKLLENESPIN
jgi:hypothetical protein